MSDATPPVTIETELSDGGAGWQARYNAACFYARRTEPDLLPATELLAEVLRDPSATITLDG